MGEEIVEDVEMSTNALVIASSEMGIARGRGRTRDQAGASSRGGQLGANYQSDTQPHFLGAHRDNLQDEHVFHDQEQAVTSGM